MPSLHIERDDVLVADRSPVAVALFFSLILHIPVLIFLGMGTVSPKTPLNATPIFEAMYAAAQNQRSYSLGTSAPSLNTEIAPNASGLSVAPSKPIEMPRLLSSIPDNLMGKSALLPPLALPMVAGGAFNVEERGRTWFAWYSTEIQRRISTNFPRQALLEKGISGEVLFRLSLTPDGAVKYVDVLRSDHPALAKAAEVAVKHAEPFPSYCALGLPSFPPLNITCAVLPDKSTAESQEIPSAPQRNLSASRTCISQ